jgi:hypothetical protein
VRPLLTLLLLTLAACASTPEEAEPAFDPRWWTGVWVLDVPRLTADAAALDPEARDLATGLAQGAAAAWRLELGDGFLRRRLGDEGVAQPVEVVALDATHVRLKGPAGEVVLRRDAEGARLDHLPVRRPGE